MKNILFYCSGGGYGHLARTSAVLPLLTHSCRVTVASKESKWPFQKPNNFHYVRLTNVDVRARFYDKVIKTQIWNGTDTSLVPFQRQMTEFFELAGKLKPEVIIIDSTPELAIIAKLFGYKVIYVYESLKTNEMRFDLAWLNSNGIIFTYPEFFVKEMDFPYPEKIKICGGYTRLENYPVRKTVTKRDILITFGKGENGEETMGQLINNLSPLGRKVSVLKGGFDRDFLKKFPIEIIECRPEEVAEVISSAELLICGAGYNTLMEAFLLRKKIIAIPLVRPYDEQVVKAELFEKMGALKVLLLENISEIAKLIAELDKSGPIDEIQESIVDGKGALRAAKYILELVNKET